MNRRFDRGVTNMSELGFSALDQFDESKLRFADIGGQLIRYYEDGAGEPLILIPGGEYGSLYSLDAWSLNFAGLAKHFHIYALDKPGQAYSDIPQQDSDYTFEWMFDSICRFVRLLGIAQAHFVGHSRGGLACARMALDHPELIKTAVLVDSSTTAPEDPHVPSDLFYDVVVRGTASGPPSLATVRVEPEAQSVSKAHITSGFLERLLKIAQRPSVIEAQTRMHTLRHSVWYPSLYRERARTLAQIDERGLPVPTLLIWGFNDRAAPLHLGHRLFERICPHTPDAEFHVLNRTGHYVFREQWHKFNRLVESFCSK